MGNLRAVLYDTVKQKEVVYEDDYPYEADNALYQWLEGNYSCDDNRGLFVAEVLGEPDPEYPCGEDKVILKALYLDGKLIGQDEVNDLAASNSKPPQTHTKSAPKSTNDKEETK